MSEIHRTFTGRIRSITIGDLMADNQYVISVNNKERIDRDSGLNFVVDEIVRDENAYFLFGRIEYLIYCKVVGTKEVFLWQRFVGYKVKEEFFIPQITNKKQ